MRKLLSLFAILVVAIGIQIQGQTASVLLSETKTNAEYATPVTQTGSVTTWFLITNGQQQPATQDLIVHLDSISGGAHASTVKLYGAKFVPYTWTQIGSTVTWKAVSGDTTILVSNATANRYRYYKLEVVNATGDGTSIAWWKFKLWKE
jgi:hypothetical protein